NDYHICHFYESGMLQDHDQVEDMDEIQEVGEVNANVIDYDDIAKEIYFLHSPPTIMSYKQLFLVYEQLAEDKRSLISAFLLTLETAKAYLLTYNLFHDIRKLWQVVDYVTILEAIIGHAPNCPG